MPLLLPDISPVHDPALAARLDAAIDGKTKPRGSLGRLEALARRIGLVQAALRPVISRPAVLVFAGDHGIAEEGVSAYPQEVTWQMVENFLAGGAAINAFARRNGVGLYIVDAGVKHDFGERSGLAALKIRHGTRNFAREPAMTGDECRRALEAGMAFAAGVPGNVLGFGEMGIANTSAAAAILHRLGGVPLRECVGAGAGLDAEGVRRKERVLEGALALHGAAAPLDVLAAFGGYEIAMMAGAMLRGAAERRLLLIDGFIVGSALMVAAALRPAVLDYCVFGHRSDEHGHARMLECLGAEPLLDLGLRLGEGTGAVLALPLLHAAVDFLCDMATFDSAGVDERRTA